jgi:hypothetical protein
MALQDKHLRAFIRLDGKHRPISGTTVLRLLKPKVGKWKEVQTYLCCPKPIPPTTTTTTTTIVSFSIVFDNVLIATAGASCGNPISTFTYYSRTPLVGTGRDIGKQVFVDSNCTLLFNGQEKWAHCTATDIPMKISTIGVIMDVDACKP